MHIHTRQDILPPLVPTCIGWKKPAELIVASLLCSSCFGVEWWPFVAVNTRVVLAAHFCVPILVFLRFARGMTASSVFFDGQPPVGDVLACWLVGCWSH